ncbi:MAG: ABC transporter ATP-binding protein, partial [Pseudomonadota bacterium]
MPLPAEADLLLQATAISKQFGGLAALTDVSLTIRRNEIYGL